METYEQMNKDNNNEYFKYITAKLYDNVLEEVYFRAEEKLKEQSNIYHGLKLIQNFESKYFEFPKNI